ncbi:MAG: hypothetical protein K8F91_08490, partial [Candidatus Obscuribacterales bacterium]|nr:hypothetical protein [Candidatus Obscuribacterales bacterium]
MIGSIFAPLFSQVFSHKLITGQFLFNEPDHAVADIENRGRIKGEKEDRKKRSISQDRPLKRNICREDTMLETTGALMRNIVQGPSTVDFLRLEVRDCDLTFGFWNQPGTRVMSDYLRSWTSMEAERAISAVHKYHSTASLSSATVLAGSRRDSLEGIDLSLSGASRLSGSMAATSIALNLSDDTRVDADMLDADSVLVTAFGNSRVHVKKVKATRMLLIADSSSLIEVETASC